MAELLLVVSLGLCAGVIAGLFGVGGGVIFVPTLTLIVGLAQLEAEATSLLAIIPVAILGSWRQSRAGHVNWRDATTIGAISAAAAIGGALLAEIAPERGLRIGFAALLLFTAVSLVLRERRARPGAPRRT